MYLRIRSARKEAKLSQQVIADACRVSRNAVTQWESDNLKTRTEPSVDKLKIISRMTGKSLMYLLDEPENVEFVKLSKGRVPLISWVQAGNWVEAMNNFELGDAEEWLPAVGGSESVFCLRVVGDSMTSPHGDSFPEGSIIWVDPEQRNPNNGDYIIAKHPGGENVTFKQYKINESGGCYLKPLNTAHPTIFEEFSVVGKIIWSGKKH